jgi:hypothetical protein
LLRDFLPTLSDSVARMVLRSAWPDLARQAGISDSVAAMLEPRPSAERSTALEGATAAAPSDRRAETRFWHRRRRDRTT